MIPEKKEKLLAFVKEYVELCDRHGVMILSEGEELQVDEADDNLWGIRDIAEGQVKEDWGYIHRG